MKRRSPSRRRPTRAVQRKSAPPVVLKLGGELLEEPVRLKALARAIVSEIIQIDERAKNAATDGMLYLYNENWREYAETDEAGEQVVGRVLLERKISARLILRRNRAQPQGADVGAARQFGLRQHFGPREHG